MYNRQVEKVHKKIALRIQCGFLFSDKYNEDTSKLIPLVY